MIELSLVLLRAGGRLRPVLVALCTATVSALILIGLTVSMLPEHPQEPVFVVIADPGTRGGFVFATLLLVIPPLLLLHQAIRWGSAARERRLAGLRLAGATPGDLRRLGAVEVGIPSIAGAVAGVGAYFVLRVLLGGGAAYSYDPNGGGQALLNALQGLVPTSVTPAWWAFLLVAAGVGVAGAVVGSVTARHVRVTPHGVSRHREIDAPRPWGLLLLVLAGLLVPTLLGGTSNHSTLIGSSVVALVLVGVVSLAPWVAMLVGRRSTRRATSATDLLAARRLVVDPRPAGRAAAGVGGIALVAGGAGAFAAAIFGGGQGSEVGYTAPLVLVVLCLVVALGVVSVTMAVHVAESAVDSKRSSASLLALGCEVSGLENSYRQEATMVALPLAAGGVVLGTLASGLVMGDSITPIGWLLMLGVCAVVPCLVWVAARVGVRLARPMIRASSAPENLRTA